MGPSTQIQCNVTQEFQEFFSKNYDKIFNLKLCSSNNFPCLLENTYNKYFRLGKHQSNFFPSWCQCFEMSKFVVIFLLLKWTEFTRGAKVKMGTTNVMVCFTNSFVNDRIIRYNHILYVWEQIKIRLLASSSISLCYFTKLQTFLFISKI